MINIESKYINLDHMDIFENLRNNTVLDFCDCFEKCETFQNMKITPLGVVYEYKKGHFIGYDKNTFKIENYGTDLRPFLMSGIIVPLLSVEIGDLVFSHNEAFIVREVKKDRIYGVNLKTLEEKQIFTQKRDEIKFYISFQTIFEISMYNANNKISEIMDFLFTIILQKIYDSGFDSVDVKLEKLEEEGTEVYFSRPNSTWIKDMLEDMGYLDVITLKIMMIMAKQLGVNFVNIYTTK